jgi:hypothetical protein
MKQAIATSASAINIAFLYPILEIYEVAKKETSAILKSLYPSREAAVLSNTK